MDTRCGIDLGTTYSAISFYDPDSQRIQTIDLDHADGYEIIPSVVYFEAGGNVVVGETARDAALQYPERVIVGIKRSMGNDYQTAPIDGKSFTPPEVSAEILKVLKADAELYLGGPVIDVVISVPAYFGDRQRAATQEAAELAGLKVVELISEPHAAALAFVVDRAQEVENRNLLVYDLGGGTFDITLITTERKELPSGVTGLKITTLAKEGDRELGGLDWDRVLARIVADKAMNQYGIEDPHLDPKLEAVLLKSCEQAKRDLSRTSVVAVIAGQRQYQVDVSRSEFEQDTRDLVVQTETLLEMVLEEAEKSHGLLTEKRIQELVNQGTPRTELEPKKVRLLLCGGSTRMPMIHDCVTRVMGEPPIQHRNPELLVTIGAAYQAYLKQPWHERLSFQEGIIDLNRDHEREVPSKPLQFTALYPKEVAVETWNTLLVYAQTASSLAAVRADALRFKAEIGPAPREATSQATWPVARGMKITLVPRCKGITFNPQRVSFLWLEEWHRTEFRFLVEAKLAGSAGNGVITFYAGPLIIATLKIPMLFETPQALSQTTAKATKVTTEPYRQVFASYSHKDTQVVLACRNTYRALGDEVLIDVDSLRAGQAFQSALMRLIDTSDIFQLFWSARSAKSPYVRREWEYALQRDKGEGFIRPVYWEQPMVPPPPPLAQLHFDYQELPELPPAHHWWWPFR